MESAILKQFGAVESNKYTDHMFLTGLKSYFMEVDGAEIYFSECDFRTGEDLRGKGRIDFYFIKGKLRGFIKMSKELVRFEPNLVILELKHCVNERFSKQKQSK